MLYPIDHPAFQRHKHVKLHSHAALIYPIGAGGHFLLGSLAGHYDVDPEVNEYEAHSVVHLAMDKLLSDISDQGFKLDTDDLGELAGRWISVTLRDRANTELLACHVWPRLTAELYDLSITELIRITWTSDVAPFIAALSWYKALFSRRLLPWKVSGLLNDAMTSGLGKVDHMSYRTRLQGLNIDDPHGPPFTDTYAGWYYYLHCHRYGFDASDIANLQAWVSAGLDNHREVLREHAQHLTKTKSRDLAVICHDRLTEMDYSTLFFDLIIPSSSKLAMLSRSDIAAYSRRNLLIARRISPMLPDEKRERWDHLLHYLSTRLDDRLQ